MERYFITDGNEFLCKYETKDERDLYKHCNLLFMNQKRIEAWTQSGKCVYLAKVKEDGAQIICYGEEASVEIMDEIEQEDLKETKRRRKSIEEITKELNQREDLKDIKEATLNNNEENKASLKDYTVSVYEDKGNIMLEVIVNPSLNNMISNLLNDLEKVTAHKVWQSKTNQYISYNYEPFCIAGYDLEVTLNFRQDKNKANFYAYLIENKLKELINLEKSFELAEAVR